MEAQSTTGEAAPDATTGPADSRTGPWTVICVPGREDDGSDSAWFAWDRDARASSPPLTRREAARLAKQYNAAGAQASSDFAGPR